MSPLAKLVEAALFASARPLTVEEIQTLDPQTGAAAVRAALAEIRDAFATGDHGVELVEIAQGWQFLTRREYAEAIDRAQFALRPRRLSPAALETLAIIAYRQPVGRLEVDEIRGVDSGAVIEKLSERGLVEIVTRGEGLGRPLLYGTTPQFLEILGLAAGCHARTRQGALQAHQHHSGSAGAGGRSATDSSSSRGSSSRSLRPRISRNCGVVPYSSGRPSPSPRVTISTSPRSLSFSITAPESTPRISSTSTRPTGCR